MILIIAYGIDFLDSRIGRKNNEDIERIHKEAYKWIDENTENPELARERKAEIDILMRLISLSQQLFEVTYESIYCSTFIF
jgi:hypothetical protein